MTGILEKKAKASTIGGPIGLPESLWEHPLFRGSAEFVPESAGVAAARCDRRIRRIRHMPSSSDSSADSVLDGCSKVYAFGAKWLEGLKSPDAVECRETLLRLKRAAASLASDISPETATRIIAMLRRSIPARFHSRLPADTALPVDARDSLSVLSMLVLDDFMSREPALRERYLKRIYRAVDSGLQFNSTTDIVRLRPVLIWIRDTVRSARLRGCSYVDVGCSMLNGAPGVALASQVLREDGLFDEIHGTDVVPPSRQVALGMAREHRIHLYAGNAVERALPRPYDVILLANVHRHLDRPLQERLLSNLGLSLKDGGRLFVNWRFSDQSSPCLCLQRVGLRLAVMAETNAV